MDFEVAKDIMLPFGKHLGRTVDEIAGSNEGLRYLDWVSDQPWLRGDLKDAISSYLENPGIQKELNQLMED